MSDKSLQVSLRELPRNAGSYLEVSILWTVSAGWKSEVLWLLEGDVVPLTVALTAIEEGVLVQVSGECTLHGDCVRCLSPVSKMWRIDGSDLYLETGRLRTSLKETEGDLVDEPQYIVADQVDIETLLRDTIFSSAPFQPLCRRDCLGLCAQCGVNLNDAEPGHSHENLDPRMASLADFFTKAPNIGLSE